MHAGLFSSRVVLVPVGAVETFPFPSSFEFLLGVRIGEEDRLRPLPSCLFSGSRLKLHEPPLSHWPCRSPMNTISDDVLTFVFPFAFSIRFVPFLVPWERVFSSILCLALKCDSFTFYSTCLRTFVRVNHKRMALLLLRLLDCIEASSISVLLNCRVPSCFDLPTSYVQVCQP